jgi:hypothetical protein
VSKLLTLKEANEIAAMKCAEYGLDKIQFELEWSDWNGRNQVNAVQRVKRHHRWWFNTTFRKEQFDARCLEEAVLKLEQYLAGFNVQVEQADQIRRNYADHLISEELKKE